MGSQGVGKIRFGKELSARDRRLFITGSVMTLLSLAVPPPARAGGVQRDVSYVPTPHRTVKRMLEMAAVAPEDYVVDLGSGDGRIVIAAAKLGARAAGVDIDPRRIAESRENARRAGVENDVRFIEGDIFEYDFTDATVVTLYLLEHLNIRLRPTTLQMRPGTRIVSHAFGMGDWRADKTEFIDGRVIHLWIVPAPVEGRWAVSDGRREFALELAQEFQSFSGTALFDAIRVPLRETALRGDEIRFNIDRPDGGTSRFVGRIRGDEMVSVPEKGAWRAIREPS